MRIYKFGQDCALIKSYLNEFGKHRILQIKNLENVVLLDVSNFVYKKMWDTRFKLCGSLTSMYIAIRYVATYQLCNSLSAMWHAIHFVNRYALCGSLSVMWLVIIYVARYENCG